MISVSSPDDIDESVGDSAPDLSRDSQGGAAWRLGVFVAAITVNICLVVVFGISDGSDSGRYYGSAEAFLNGEMPTGKARSYLGYSLFITPFVALGLGKVAIACAQILLSGIATVCLFLLGARFYGKSTGVLAAAAYVLFPDIHYWNLIVYADSLFSSMMLISTYLLLTPETRWRKVSAITLAVYTCTIRPHGVGFATALIVYGIYLLCVDENYKILLEKNYKLAAVLAALLAFSTPFVWLLLGRMVGYERVLDTYTGGQTIWGYTDNALTMPGDVSERTGQMFHPLLAMLSFVAEKPLYFLQLAGIKLYYLLSHVRPYFTGVHNLLSLVVLVPAYVFAYIGLPVRTDEQRPMRMLLVSIFSCQALIIVLTFADWDGRFLIPILFVLFLFAAEGLVRSYDAYRARRAS